MKSLPNEKSFSAALCVQMSAGADLGFSRGGGGADFL